VVTWRLWVDPASRTVAGNPDDADLFAWYMRYAATALSHGQLPALVTSALNAPAGINLMWNSSSLLLAVLLAPVTLLFGAQASLTVLTTVGFAGSAAAMYWVLRRWRISLFAAGLSGALYGFCPALLQSAIGHYDLQFAVLPPLIIDAVLRVVCGPPPADAPIRPVREAEWPAFLPPHVRAGYRLGLLITIQLFISEELALTTVAAGVLLVAVLATGFHRQVLSRLRAAVVGAAVAAGTTLALAGWALWIQFFGPLTQSGSPFLRDWYVNDLSGFVTPSGNLLFHTSASAAAASLYRGGAPEYLAYLGWPLIIVLVTAAVVFWANPIVRALTGTALLLSLLSLGGYPLVSGVSHTGVDLPWHWIEDLPLAGSVLPDRFSILIDGLAAALLAFLVDLAAKRWRDAAQGRVSVAVRAIAVLACLPLVPLPLPVASATPLPVGWSAAFGALHLPAGATVLVVPVPEVHLTAAMRWQADSGQRYDMIGGYFIGPAWNGLAYVDGNGLLVTSVYLDELWVAGLPPGSPLAALADSDGLGSRRSSPPVPSQVRADLANWRPAAVVAVTSAGSALARYLAELFGRPTVRTGGVLAWRLGSAQD
jgi:hypothetical protein